MMSENPAQSSRRASAPPGSGTSPIRTPIRLKRPEERRFERALLAGLLGLPSLGALIGAWLLWTSGISALDVALLVSLYVITGLGVTVGYHRLFTHRSFQCAPWLRRALAIAGSLAVEGPIIRWAADHRRHHQHSDHDGDPHSPHRRGRIGLFHAHIGWFFAPDTARASHFAKDLLEEPMIRRTDQLYPLWMVLTLAIPAFIGLAWTGTASGMFSAFIWGGLVRVFLGHHATWLVNSICHTVGSRTYRTDDASTNNALVALLTFGEGWHNNHHAFPTSARQGLRFWQIDIGWYVIRLLEFTGLARNVHVPDALRLARAARRNEPGRRPS
jgi:stearoyl-CoA desaturase (delta-9 desaturase)